jgi:hypothetical protein
MIWQVILMQVSIDINIPHNIVLPLHRVEVRGISAGAPAWRDSVGIKFSLPR